MSQDKNAPFVMVRNLKIAFRQKGKIVKAVKNVSFDIQRGEIFSIVGESGSGKTTISRAIAGIQKITNGSVYMHNRLLRGQPPKLAAIYRVFTHNCQIIFDNQAQIAVETSLLMKHIKKILSDNSGNGNIIRIIRNTIFALEELIKGTIRFLKANLEIHNVISKFVTGLHKLVPEITFVIETLILQEISKGSEILTSIVAIASKTYRDLQKIKKTLLIVKNDDDQIITILAQTKEFLACNEELLTKLRVLDYYKNIAQFLFLSAKARKKMFLKTFRGHYLKPKKHNFTNQKCLFMQKWQQKKDLFNFIFDENTIKKHYEKQKIVWKRNYKEKTIMMVLNWLQQLPDIDQVVKKSTFFAPIKWSEKKQRKRDVQMIFQDPYASLNNHISVAEIISEGLNAFPKIYQTAAIKKAYEQQEKTLPPTKHRLKSFLINNIVKEVGLLPEHLSRYSHEFSGGQRQRIGIARALVMNPQLVVADEPISALDVSIRAQIINLLKDLQKKYHLTILFVAHDLTIVNLISDRIAVLYQGKIVELAPAATLFTNPLHPYTVSLIAAIPIPNPGTKGKVNFVYEPEKEHYDYHYNLPEWVEISKGHYLYANSREIAVAKAKLDFKYKERSKDATF